MTTIYTILYIGLALFCAFLGAVLLLWFRIRHQSDNPVADQEHDPEEVRRVIKGVNTDTYPWYVPMHPDRIPGSSKIKGEDDDGS